MSSAVPEESVPRRRNRRGEGGLLRGEILLAAAELLDESGEEAVTLRAVARRAGIAAPSIYAHFPDRQSIVLAVVQQALTELTEHLRAAAAAPADDPVAGLRAVCAAYLAFAGLHPQRYRLLFGGLWDAAAAAAGSTVTPADVASLGTETLEVLAAGLRACVAAGRSRSTDPWADAVALWLGLHGLADQRVAATAFPWPRDVADRIVSGLAGIDPQRPTA